MDVVKIISYMQLQRCIPDVVFRTVLLSLLLSLVLNNFFMYLTQCFVIIYVCEINSLTLLLRVIYQYVVKDLNLQITLFMWYCGNISLRFSSNSKANASELLECRSCTNMDHQNFRF